MSSSLVPSNGNNPAALNSCGCCDGVDATTPQSIVNRPGLDELRYRIGTHQTFFQSMIARLTQLCEGSVKDCSKGGGTRPLKDKLTTRNPSDPAIAILDGWSLVADVLTFYQERIANEGYLRTANERRSLYEISRLVGYQPRPGVSANVYLAFEVEMAPSVTTAIGFISPGQNLQTADAEILIPKGTQAKSTPTPGTDETPQVFETSFEFKSRPSWNEIRLATTRPYDLNSALAVGLEKLRLKGIGLRINPNDVMVLSFGGRSHVARQVVDIVEETERQITVVTLSGPAISTQRFAEAIQSAADDYLLSISGRNIGDPQSTQLAKYVRKLVSLILSGKFVQRPSADGSSDDYQRPIDFDIAILSIDAAVNSVLESGFPAAQIGAFNEADAKKIVEELNKDLRRNPIGSLKKSVGDLTTLSRQYFGPISEITESSDAFLQRHLASVAFLKGAVGRPLELCSAPLSISSDALGIKFSGVTEDEEYLAQITIIDREASKAFKLRPSSGDPAGTDDKTELSLQGKASEIQSQVDAVKLIGPVDGACSITLVITKTVNNVQTGSAVETTFIGSTGPSPILTSGSSSSIFRPSVMVPSGSKKEITAGEFLGVEDGGFQKLRLSWNFKARSDNSSITVLPGETIGTVNEVKTSLNTPRITVSRLEQPAIPVSVVYIGFELRGSNDANPDWNNISPIAVAIRPILVYEKTGEGVERKLRDAIDEGLSICFQTPATAKGYRDAAKTVVDQLKTIAAVDVGNAVAALKAASDATAAIDAITTPMATKWLAAKASVASDLQTESDRFVPRVKNRIAHWLSLSTLPPELALADLRKALEAYFRPHVRPLLQRLQASDVDLQAIDTLVDEISDTLGVTDRIAEQEFSEFCDQLAEPVLTQRIQTIDVFVNFLDRFKDDQDVAAVAQLPKLKAMKHALGVFLDSFRDKRLLKNVVREVPTVAPSQVEKEKRPFIYVLGSPTNSNVPRGWHEWSDSESLWKRIAEPLIKRVIRRDNESGPVITALQTAPAGGRTLFDETTQPNLAAWLRARMDDDVLRKRFSISFREISDERWWQLADLHVTELPPNNRFPRITTLQVELQRALAQVLMDLGVATTVDANRNIPQSELLIAVEAFQSLISGNTELFRGANAVAETVNQFLDFIPQVLGALNRSEQQGLVELLRQYKHEPIGLLSKQFTVSILRSKSRVFGWNAPEIIPGTRVAHPDKVSFANRLISDEGCAPDAGGDTCRTAFAAVRSELTGGLLETFVNSVGNVLTDPKSPSVVNEVLTNSSSDAEAPTRLFLDGAFERVIPGSTVVLHRNNLPLHTCAVVGTQTRPRSAYGLSGESTVVELSESWWDARRGDFAAIRTTRVHCDAENLIPGESILDEVLPPADGFELNGLYAGLYEGQRLLVSGTPAEFSSNSLLTRTELVEIAAVTVRLEAETYGARFRTHVQIRKPLRYRYLRDTVRIRANVVEATHGESVTEILGIGPPTAHMPSFCLKRSPLTFVAAPTLHGIDSTLTISVNETDWYGQNTLNASSPHDTHFLLGVAADGSGQIVFGDGENGARLPNGEANVKADYRVGVGRSGNVDSFRIDQLAGAALGIKGVVNPLRADGGADADRDEIIREYIPKGLLSLSRLVSIGDFRDFAEQFAGISRVHAISHAGRILLTVSGFGTEPLPLDHRILTSLRDALGRHSDGMTPFAVYPHRPVLIALECRLAIRPSARWEDVKRRISSALTVKFSFSNSRYLQRIEAADVFKCLQADTDIVYADIDSLKAIREDDVNDSIRRVGDQNTDSQDSSLQSFGITEILASGPDVSDENSVRGAELCYISPDVRDTVRLYQIEGATR